MTSSTSRNSSSDEWTLVGAGLAGSLLAAFLSRRGHAVRLFESRPDMRRHQISAGRSINLALANRGIRALDAVGLMDRIRPLMITMKGRMLHDLQGNQTSIPYGRTPDEVIYSISRGELNKTLLTAAEETGNVEIHFDHRLESYLPGEDRLEFRDLTSDQVVTKQARLVLGTDGSASRMRDAIVEATGGDFSHERLEHGYKELTIPAGKGGAYQIEKHALHIWPRGEYMLIALPNIDGSFTVTLFLPLEGAVSFASLDTPARVMEFFGRQFADAVPLIPDLAGMFFENPTGHMGTVRCRPWSLGDRALLLGDAAHAIVPFHGQGMNCAFEDCHAFDRLHAADPGGPLSELFRRFEEERRVNSDAIAEMALENYVEMRATVADPRFQLKKKVAWILEERHPGRFIPRYSMVMFHSIPYHQAKSRGRIQESILDQLVDGIEDPAQVDLPRADLLIADRLEPIAPLDQD